jgi:hypothetical protein
VHLERGHPVRHAFLGVGYHVQNTPSQLLKGASLRLGQAEQVAVGVIYCHAPSLGLVCLPISLAVGCVRFASEGSVLVQVEA